MCGAGWPIRIAPANRGTATADAPAAATIIGIPLFIGTPWPQNMPGIVLRAEITRWLATPSDGGTGIA